MKYLANLDLGKNELQNARAHNLASAPSAPGEGQFYFNTGDDHLYFWTGTVWFDLTNALTLAGNAENLYARLASPAFSGVPTVPTTAAGTDTTQVASTAFTIAEIASRLAIGDFAAYKGAIDASANPNYPAGNAGNTYRISVAGKIGGASGPNVEAGDIIMLHVDNSAGGTQASVGADWDIIQINIDGAVTLTGAQTISNKTINGASNTFSNIPGTSVVNTPAGNIVAATAQAAINELDTEKAALAGATFTGDINVPAEVYGVGWNGSNEAPTKNDLYDKIETISSGAALRYSTDVGDNAATSFVITHNLGTRDLVASLRSATTPWEQVMCDVEFASTNTATLRFAAAPTANQFRVTFVG